MRSYLKNYYSSKCKFSFHQSGVVSFEQYSLIRVDIRFNSQFDILSYLCQNIINMLVRTTLRLKENIKRSAQKKALEEKTTLQEIFNRALEAYLEKDAKKWAKKIVFKTYRLGKKLDNLTRDDFYPDPKF